MILCNGYLIVQEKNRIIINLPQTRETIASTDAPLSNRKQKLNTHEEATLLWLAIQMFEGKEE